MWIRYHIKCHNCDKITNLRLHLTSTEEIDVKFNCPNCSSEIVAQLIIDYPKFKNYKPSLWTRLVSLFKKDRALRDYYKNFHDSLNFNVIRGSTVDMGFESGDYFVEYSESLPVAQSSSISHPMWTAVLRENPKKMIDLATIDGFRNFYSDELWQDFSDLITAFQNSNFSYIEKIIERIKSKSEILKDHVFDFSDNLGFINAYFFTLNNFLFPWIDYNKHSSFIEFLFEFMFSSQNLSNPKLQQLCSECLQPDFLSKFNIECSALIQRFISVRKNFKNTYQNESYTENIISNPDFVSLKNFYTDCFEFIGRESVIALKMMNLIERGDCDLMPEGVPRNIVSSIDFKNMDHGARMDVISKCSTECIVDIFADRFDSKLRNGINHNKAEFDSKSQKISYFPITKKPNEKFELSYNDFLVKTLDIFESVLRMNQFIKMFHYYDRDKKIL